MAAELGFEEAVSRVRAAFARPPRTLALPGFQPAAVLVALLRRPAGPTVLFTRRTDTVRHHKGEISFPGGGREGLEDPPATALREAEEEVGLAPERVEVLGVLDDLPSITGYLVTPVAAAVREPPAAFRPQATEVLEPFEVPLAHLLSPGVRQEIWWDPAALPPDLPAALVAARLTRGDRDPATGRIRGWAFDAGPDRLVWGLTGYVLATVLDHAFS
jgi:8-oxo-dGTP pyrophosphatase MutT (NUDIX family)